jgi:hypothetical protein
MAIKLAPAKDAPKAPPLEPEIEVDGNGLDGTARPPEIPPPDAPKKVSKYARFAATEAIVAAAQEQTHNCLWGSPPKTSYVRAYPDPTFCRDLHVLVHEVRCGPDAKPTPGSQQGSRSPACAEVVSRWRSAGRTAGR